MRLSIAASHFWGQAIKPAKINKGPGSSEVGNIWMESGSACQAYPEYDFMHGVQLSQVLLSVRVSVVKMDGGGGSMAGLSYNGSKGPGQLVNQIRPDNDILDQTARRSGSRSRHFHHATGTNSRFVYVPVHPLCSSMLRNIKMLLPPAGRL